MVIEFKECAECAAKSGSPELCPSCQKNRSTISFLVERSKDVQTKAEDCIEDEVKEKFDTLYEYFNSVDLNSLEEKGLHLLHEEFYKAKEDLLGIVKSTLTVDWNRK